MMCDTSSSPTGNYTRLLRSLVAVGFLAYLHAESTSKFPECRPFLVQHDCYYFACLDAHYFCGVESHLTRLSRSLCLLSTKKYVPALTKPAQIYFNRTNACVLRSLQNQLPESSISARFTCTRLQATILDVNLKCFRNQYREKSIAAPIDLCSIICDDLQTIIDLFLNLNDASLGLFRLLTETGRACGATISESMPRTVPTLLLSICLDRKDVRLTKDITLVMTNARFESKDYDWIDG